MFAGAAIPLPHALVMLLPMDAAAVRTAPSFECLRTVNETYASLGVLTERVAGDMQRRGFSAVPGEAIGGAVDYLSLAARAGLGAVTASGLLASEGHGTCQRIGAVFLELEEAPSRPPASRFEWVGEYCVRCQRCVRDCPAQAIRSSPPLRADGHAACVDGDRCLAYFRSHWGCSVCIKVCPLISGDLDKVRRGRGRSVRPGSRAARSRR
ncbi:MAG: 4Fe-4S dicluster domain-containing protein [Myxococcales bacterium]